MDTGLKTATREEVEETVRREFPAEQFTEAMAILDKVQMQDEGQRARFQTNLLALSHGRLDYLRENLDHWYTNYVSQPIPKVTHKHVERIVRRDYPAERFAEVMAILNQYGTETGGCEIHRVPLAVLKLADRKLDALREYVEAAKTDYRDVISWAEYPGYNWQTKLPAAEQKRIVDGDWKQYIAWANAK